MFEKLKTFISECWRVLRVTKKPDKQEFSAIVKVTALGLAIIGLVGMIVYMIGTSIVTAFG
jgi:protein transport protein SEC61 subunit gamma-like protein